MGRLLSVSPFPFLIKIQFWYGGISFRLLLPFNSSFSTTTNQLFIVFSLRHLSDSSHRETYESAHSVILSIFAFHAQRQQQHTGKTKTTTLLWGELNDGGGDNKHEHGPEDGRVFTPISNPLRDEAEEESVDLANFVERMVPFYAQCLIEVCVISLTFKNDSIFLVFTLPSSPHIY